MLPGALIEKPLGGVLKPRRRALFSFQLKTSSHTHRRSGVFGETPAVGPHVVPAEIAGLTQMQLSSVEL